MFIALLRYGEKSLTCKTSILALDTCDMSIEEISIFEAGYVPIANLLTAGTYRIRYKYLHNIIRQYNVTAITVDMNILTVFGVDITYKELLTMHGAGEFWHPVYAFKFSDYIAIRMVTDAFDWATLITDMTGKFVAAWSDFGLCTDKALRSKLDTISRF